MGVESRLRCRECDRKPPDVRLYSCPVCRAQTCADHSYRMSGKGFCSKNCAMWFFHSDDAESDGSGDEA